MQKDNLIVYPTVELGNIDKQQIDFSRLDFNLCTQSYYRFYSVDEVSEGKAQQYRVAMSNVLACVGQNNSTIIYLLSGTPEGIKLYIGIASDNFNTSEDGKLLRSAFEGNFIGSKLTELKSDDTQVLDLFEKIKHVGLVTGVPSLNEVSQSLDGQDFQGIERLAKTLNDATWQLVVVAKSGSEVEIRHHLNHIYDFSTELSTYIKQSVQQSENNGSNRSETHGTSSSQTHGTSTTDTNTKNRGTSDTHGQSAGSSSGGSSSSTNKGTSSSKATNDGTSESIAKGKSDSDTQGNSQSITEGSSSGTSISLTQERINKRLEQLQNHLNEHQIPRFQTGLGKGMFKTAIYFCTENQATYSRLAGSIKSIFQGDQSTLAPLNITKLAVKKISLANMLHLKDVSMTGDDAFECTQSAMIHSIPMLMSQDFLGATWLNTNELALVTGLPSEELPGLKLRKNVSFALNTADESSSTSVMLLGNMIHDGRILSAKKVKLSSESLNKHIFVTGVTGAGKTTTCMKLLLESNLPFMVIEPAKTEYRALSTQIKDIQYYCLGHEDLSTFRLNPFELVSKYQNLTGHISMLKATLIAVFPMEASMPSIVENAIIRAYEEKGWDIASNVNYLVDDAWNTAEDVWPTFSDMIAQLEIVIKSAGMGKEFEEKYQGSLVSRLAALTDGIKGIMVNTRRSIDFNQLLNQKVVIELEELKDEEDKAFFMGLIVGRLAECMKQRHRQDHDFRHMTLIEEAHRLLSRPEPGSDGSKAMGVEMFANLLAEVRKYGESLIIADQIPNKLVSDVIKNTNTKIVHRLFAADDRNTIGDAIGLNDEQKNFLPLLQAGETIVYSGGWHAPVRAQIDQLANTNSAEVDEADIAEIGCQQRWHQRHVLFPRFSTVHQWVDAHHFSTAIQHCRELINIIIRMCRLISIKKNAQVEKLAKRLSEKIHCTAEKIQLNTDELAIYLSALCFDCFTPAWPQDSEDSLLHALQELIQVTADSIEHIPGFFKNASPLVVDCLIGNNQDGFSIQQQHPI